MKKNHLRLEGCCGLSPLLLFCILFDWKKASVFIFTFGILLNNAYSVPLPSVDKYDITGTISEIEWYPKKFIKGISGMSGSAGKDRIMPPHYILKLTDYEGISSEDALKITRYIKWDTLNNNEKREPPFILVKVNHKNRYFLKKGMRIKIKGYTVRGDESGTYTYYEKIEVLGYSKNTPN
ncbi:hypothetical protein V4D30_03895 [Thermodesulfovibrio sp. 3907-1M]|uniref:Uncharacterized protein n=1 Tax=Thermodesulfovibrio autotrophicus TaxID=3118333 RepID=A0AAU8H1B3_9BACT